MLRSIAIAAVVALSGGGIALAQDYTGADLVDSIFAREERESGIRAAGQSQGTLPAQVNTVYIFDLQAGKTYMVIGVCDEDCSNLDLSVYSPSGEDLGSDFEPDDFPIVVFEAATTGEYVGIVQMIACASAICNYGVRFYEQ